MSTPWVLPENADPMANNVRDTIWAMIALFLWNGSRDIVNDFASIPTSGLIGRGFEFEGHPYVCSKRARNDLFTWALGTSIPGVNVYFGDDVEDYLKTKPRKWTLPVIVHVGVAWGENFRAVEKTSIRIGEEVMKAFEGLGGRVQVCDFSSGSPVPVVGRFASWVKSPGRVWREESQPNKDSFTNRQCSIEVRYAR